MFGINSYYDIVNYVQTAVGEMGYCEYTQEDYADRIKKAKRRGVRDIGGWLADTAGYQALFLVSFAFSIAGLAMLRWWVREPRRVAGGG